MPLKEYHYPPRKHVCTWTSGGQPYSVETLWEVGDSEEQWGAKHLAAVAMAMSEHAPD